MERKRRKPKRPRRQNEADKSPQEVFVRALHHPTRVQALTILSERVASPREIADELEVHLSNVSYHVRVLDDLGLVEIVDEEPVRGSVAHFYKAVARPLVDNSAWRDLDPKVRNAVSAHLLETLINDAADSLAAGVFDKRKDRHLTRTPLMLDDEGWKTVAEIQAKAVEGILKEQAAALARMNGSARGIRAIFAMFCFEMPPEAED